MTPRLTYFRTRPAPDRDRFVLGLLETAADLGLDTSSIDEIVIGAKQGDAVREVRSRFGLLAGEQEDTDGCVIRNPERASPCFAVILPVRTLRKARDRYHWRADSYRHKVIHEFAHCHDLSAALTSPIGTDFANAAKINPKSFSIDEVQLAFTLLARAEYAACRLSAGYDSSIAEDDAYDAFLKIEALSCGVLPEDMALYASNPILGTVQSAHRIAYWWASVAGHQDGGKPVRYLPLEDAMMRRPGLHSACRRLASELRFLHERGPRSWTTMSVFDGAVEAFEDIQLALLEIWNREEGITKLGWDHQLNGGNAGQG